MRFGVCASVEKAPLLAAAGYDYIELSVAGDLIPNADESEWDIKRAAIEAMPLRPESFNSFIRAGKITGTEVDTDYLARYVRTALQRAALIGGKIIVFGSGGARNVPDGFPRAQAQAQIREFLTLCARASDETGVVVVIEPLNRGESNILNSVVESAEYVREIDQAGVRVLADTYHMEREGEPISIITGVAPLLAHVHTADTDRFAPSTGTYDHAALFAALRKASYDSRVSIECTWRNFESEITPALRHLRKCFASGAANGAD